jgi:hypothetical protein
MPKLTPLTCYDTLLRICQYIPDIRDCIVLASTSRFTYKFISNEDFMKKWLKKKGIPIEAYRNWFAHERWWADGLFWKRWGYPCEQCWDIKSGKMCTRCCPRRSRFSHNNLGYKRTKSGSKLKKISYIPCLMCKSQKPAQECLVLACGNCCTTVWCNVHGKF